MHSTIWWIVSGLLFLGVYSVLEFVYRYRVTSRGKKKIPTQLPLPLIGNALHFLKDRSSSGVTKALGSYLPGCPISAAWLGPKLMVMVSGHQPTYNLLVKGVALKKPDDIYSVFEELMAGVFATSDVKKWVSLRRPLDKMLEPKWVEIWIDIFYKNANLLCKAIDNDTEELNLPLRTFQYSMANVAETHLGVRNVEMVEHLFPTLLEDMETAADILMRRVWDLTTKPNILFKMSKHRSEFVKSKLRLFAAFNTLLDTRKTHLKENYQDFSEEGCYTDFILSHAKRLNCDDEKTFKLGVDFIAAASHTTTFTSASAILFLAMHPEYQKKVYQEIQTVFGESTETPTEEQLNRLQYLDMVIKETLRHAGVPFFGRQLEKEVELDGYIIPKDSILLFNQILPSYNPKYWDRPKEFYPDHFTPEAEAARPKGAFLPFCYGARSCPGKLYGMISMKISLSKVVREFEFSTHRRFEDVDFNYSVLRIPSDYDVVAKRRTVFTK